METAEELNHKLISISKDCYTAILHWQNSELEDSKQRNILGNHDDVILSYSC